MTKKAASELPTPVRKSARLQMKKSCFASPPGYFVNALTVYSQPICTFCRSSRPTRPRGCKHCRQAVGCTSCVDEWFSNFELKCPLCRGDWNNWSDTPRVVIQK
uniref:RING-type domain-containing protein n=1 Tax=Panagrellus redivivus TaxID=6233 RepID=A0A7E4ULV2_PANRE